MKLALSLGLLAFAGKILACTTFAFSEPRPLLMGKNYDWHKGHAHFMVNPRGLKKKALQWQPANKPAEWTSRYGSVTVNQQGREFPLGGINEKGLAAEIMWLESSKYPDADSRPTVNELQWIQYQLDNFATVAEALAARDLIRVAPIYARVHYLLCDAEQVCGSFEYIDGKMVTHSGDDMMAKTLTNDRYSVSATYLKRFVGFGGTEAVPTTTASLHRFVRASHLAKYFTSPDESLLKAFELLDKVKQSDTQWNMVYDLENRVIHVRSDKSPKVKMVRTSEFDYACSPTAETSRVLDLHSTGEGDVTDRFEAYTEVTNRQIVEQALKELTGQLPAGAIDAVASYPSSLRCTAH